MQNLLVLMFTLFFSNVLLAQQGPGWQNMTPDSMASKTTMVMVDSLNLSSAQQKKIYAVNLSHAQKQKALRQEFMGDREGIRGGMQQIRAEHQTELAKYLTADQVAKWTAIQEQRRNNRRQQGNRKAAERRKKSQDKS